MEGLSTLHIPTDFSRFDGFEMNACQEFNAGEPDAYIEAVIGEPIPGVPVFWTVYGHLPEGGVEALIDFVNEGDANRVETALKMFRRGTSPDKNCRYCGQEIKNCAC